MLSKIGGSIGASIVPTAKFDLVFLTLAGGEMIRLLVLFLSGEDVIIPEAASCLSASELKLAVAQRIEMGIFLFVDLKYV